jgi:molecular chaperone GrpE
MEKENQKSINEDKDKVQDLKDSKRSENTYREKKELSIEEKYKELEDKLTRSYAEIENQRRRYEKEIDDAFQYGGMALAKETLNIADNLERSKLSITNDQNLDLKSKDKIIEHIDIIYKDVVSIFRKNQIEEIKALGEKMDPNKHQAMMEVEDENKDPGTIVQEIQKGF